MIIGFSAGATGCDSNVDRMVKAIMDKSGLESEFVKLTDLTYSGCKGCVQLCAKHQVCKLEDDLLPYYEKIKEADAVVVGSPKDEAKSKGKSKGKGEEDVPEYRLVPVDTPVTIHHLLTHTSGFAFGGLGETVAASHDDTFATYAPKLAALPRVGGLHHRFEWSEAA